jgi:hypothetical protein
MNRSTRSPDRSVRPRGRQVDTLPRRALPNRILMALGALAALAAAALQLEAQASMLPTGVHQAGLSGCDDCNAAVSLTDVFPSGIRFGTEVYTELHIGTNGYITFGHGNSGYSAAGISAYTAGPIVAGQYDDLDPRKGGDIYYNQDAGGGHLVVSWVDVAPYWTPTASGSGTNTFQVVLRTSGSDPQDFDVEIRYGALNWAGSGGGAWPTAGWSAGDQATYAELEQSGRSDFRDILSGSNIATPGVYRWAVTGGIVQAPPTVNTTSSATSITGTGAVSGGNVSSDGGLTVTARGLAYGTSAGPTISGDTVVSGSGTGSFTAELTGLANSTTYYVRAYATNSLGTAYGPEQSFTTLSTVPPTVTTAVAEASDAYSASAGGDVTADGGAIVTARGVAYGTSTAPTVADGSAASGGGTGAYTAGIEGLTPGTTYYVRAWATNSAGTSYGDEVSFTTPRLDQTIDFAAVGQGTYGDGPVQLAAVATSDLAVSYASDDPTVATMAGDTLVIVGAGSAVITASQAGNAIYNAAPDVEHTLTVAARRAFGAFTVNERKTFDGTTAAEVTGRSLVGLVAGDHGQVDLAGGEAHYDDADIGLEKTVRLSGASLSGARADDYVLLDVHTTLADIVANGPDHVTLEGPSSRIAGGAGTPLTLTVRDAFGNPSPVVEPTVFSLATSAGGGSGAFAPSSRLTLPAGSVAQSFTYTHSTEDGEPHRLVATRMSGDALPGGATATHELRVLGTAIDSFRVEAVGGGPVTDQMLDSTFHVRVTAVDAYGNVARDFGAAVRLVSNGELAKGGGTTAAFENGVLASHAVAFSETGTFLVLAVIGPDGAQIGTSAYFSVVTAPSPVEVDIQVDDDRPEIGQEVTIVVTVRNRGTGAVHDISVRNPLHGQDRLELVEATAEQGTLDGATGMWMVGSLESGQRVALRVRARVIVP